MTDNVEPPDLLPADVLGGLDDAQLAAVRTAANDGKLETVLSNFAAIIGARRDEFDRMVARNKAVVDGQPEVAASLRKHREFDARMAATIEVLREGLQTELALTRRRRRLPTSLPQSTSSVTSISKKLALNKWLVGAKRRRIVSACMFMTGPSPSQLGSWSTATPAASERLTFYRTLCSQRL